MSNGVQAHQLLTNRSVIIANADLSVSRGDINSAIASLRSIPANQTCVCGLLLLRAHAMQVLLQVEGAPRRHLPEPPQGDSMQSVHSLI